jgi:hypothetical protein
MAKKCIPGLFCIGNMTLFVLVLILLGIIYLVIQVQKSVPSKESSTNVVVIPQQGSSSTLTNITSGLELPPLKVPSVFGLPSPSTPSVNIGNPAMGLVPVMPLVGGVMGGAMPIGGTIPVGGAMPIPVQIPTRGYPSSYQQVGILTSDTRKDMILPLMGRQTTTGRDKWQYYTVSNSGAIQTKLPVSCAGKSCTSEYGCNELFNGDTIFVEGYKEVFRATIYENSGLSYNPY